MEIPVINIQQTHIRPVYVPQWMIQQPNVDYLLPPVVVNVGTPIVDMPGCVKMHKDNKRHKNNLPPDGEYPTYDAMNYEPEQLTIIRETPPPPVAPPPDPPGTPETPDTGKVTPEDPPCPGPNQPREGTLGPNEKEKVSGYELQPDPTNPGKKICVILYEDIGVAEQYLPSAQVATTTAAIATVAGASALLAKPLADLLLRVFRPAIKQALTKVNAILGKTSTRVSPSQVRSNEYRKKKGLPPLKM